MVGFRVEEILVEKVGELVRKISYFDTMLTFK